MAESQQQTVADAALRGDVPDYVAQPQEKMLHMENVILLVNKNNALMQREIEILQQENQQLKTENAKILERTRDAQDAPKGFPHCNGSGASLEEELHYVKNAAILAYQQNVHLRSQLHSLLEHNQYLQAEMAKAGNELQHYDELVNKNTMFYDQIEHLQSENAKILQENHQLKAEVTTFSLQNKFLKDQNIKINQKANAERNNICRLEGLLKVKKNLQLNNDVLAFESDSQKLSEITQQLQAKDAENSVTEDWQTKYNCLQVQLTKELSEKNRSWEARFKQVEEEKINLQREKNKLLEENAQLKQEKTKQDKNKLEKEKTELLQDKTKVVEEMAELKERFLHLQTKKKMKKKQGFWSRLHTKARRDRDNKEKEVGAV
ncbi:hypothetical protein Q5P01_005461 [Channa striata]|uniref:Uncharacterized protein n=1 Tax=Channa striata TaxID=64152 RepID=A0AA88NJ80_CHASR|nr:hypothetical protein Q5P01_005461 [Channa striata]